MIHHKELSPGSLAELLELASPPLADETRPLRQLQQVEAQLRALRVVSVAIEERYVDRDHVEDHAAFYASSLGNFTNVCRRIHFFVLPATEVRLELARLTEGVADRGGRWFAEEARAFSERAYVGFMVVRPLPGSPVGRTVLRPPPPEESDGVADRFLTREYVAHLGGVPLVVEGLAFQQQDVGVSACATAALWVSFHKHADAEAFSLPSPARITRLAARFSLPFGRAMPSGGLSVDQMCQATQAVGLAPDLLGIPDLATLRAFLHSAFGSGLAVVLILENATGRHAVTLAGARMRLTHRVQEIRPGFDDRAADLESLFVHDDQSGPYVRAELFVDRRGLLPSIRLLGPSGFGAPWTVTHLLTAHHPKVRLNFADLRIIAYGILRFLGPSRDLFAEQAGIRPKPFTVGTRISKATGYLHESLISNWLTPGMLAELTTSVLLPRYLGVLEIDTSEGEPLHILVDTTANGSNTRFLAVVARRITGPLTHLLCGHLKDELRCPVIGEIGAGGSPYPSLPRSPILP